MAQKNHEMMDIIWANQRMFPPGQRWNTPF